MSLVQSMVFGAGGILGAKPHKMFHVKHLGISSLVTSVRASTPLCSRSTWSLRFRRGPPFGRFELPKLLRSFASGQCFT